MKTRKRKKPHRQRRGGSEAHLEETTVKLPERNAEEEPLNEDEVLEENGNIKAEIEALPKASGFYGAEEVSPVGEGI